MTKNDLVLFLTILYNNIDSYQHESESDLTNHALRCAVLHNDKASNY
jgi:hypothetical protein